MRIRSKWLFISCIFLVPWMGTYTYQKYRPSVDWEQSSEGLVVYMKENGVDCIADFDTYALGVLGAALSPDSHEETIKAMAVVLRTYLYFMAEGGKIVYSEALGQPWLSAEERKRKGMDDARLKEALKATEGCVLTYNGAPVLPLYYEASNGRTRNYSDVWSGEAPYLIAADSYWDKSYPHYKQKISISQNKWKTIWGEDAALTLQIVEKDASGYVKQMQIGVETYSGEEVRCRLHLPSACFEYEVEKNEVVFTCYGEGHGVGLSLYGANAMAEEGKTWQEILLWYYPGTVI